MPGGDGTGPMGMGPRTGGGRGFCAPGFFGQRFFGGGRRWPWGQPQQQDAQSELAWLEQSKQALEQQISALKKDLNNS